jgi:hypothetical protein
VMFKNVGPLARRRSKAREVVRLLSDADTNRSHNRHIHFEECREMGLNVILLEDMPNEISDFQDLILTVHHCYMHSLMNTPSIKIIENQNGVAYVKQVRAIATPAHAI